MNEYMSIPSTQSIKGIFIILVFFSHFNSYALLSSRWDLLYKAVVELFGQTMVTMFLFYSGYGVMESVKKKGIAYVNDIPSKRILSTLFRFDCAVLLFGLCRWVYGEYFTFSDLLLSLVGWEALGNSNWYIFVINLLYAITFIAFKVTGDEKPKQAFIVVLALTCAYVLVLHFWQIKPLHWYDTALCYALGMWFSLYRKQVEQAVGANQKIYVFSVLAVAVCFLLCMKLYYVPFLWVVKNLSFAVLVVLVTMGVRVGNPVLQYCGENLFEIYILQRLPMIVFHKMGMYEYPVAYFLLCCAATLLISIPFRKVVSCGRSYISGAMRNGRKS